MRALSEAIKDIEAPEQNSRHGGRDAVPRQRPAQVFMEGTCRAVSIRCRFTDIFLQAVFRCILEAGFSACQWLRRASFRGILVLTAAA